MLLYEIYLEELSPETKAKIKKAAKIGAGILGAGAAIVGAAYAAKHFMGHKDNEAVSNQHLVGEKMMPNVNPDKTELYNKANEGVKVVGNQLVIDPRGDTESLKIARQRMLANAGPEDIIGKTGKNDIEVDVKHMNSIAKK